MVGYFGWLCILVSLISGQFQGIFVHHVVNEYSRVISRAHRIGQENHVFAYRFITSGTIEEKILQMQDRKQNLADIFVNQNALNLIDPDEILGLLSE